MHLKGIETELQPCHRVFLGLWDSRRQKLWVKVIRKPVERNRYGGQSASPMMSVSWSPETGYVLLRGKGGIRLLNSRKGNYPGLSEWAQYIYKGP